jgi:hypothetical protein
MAQRKRHHGDTTIPVSGDPGSERLYSPPMPVGLRYLVAGEDPLQLERNVLAQQDAQPAAFRLAHASSKQAIRSALFRLG